MEYTKEMQETLDIDWFAVDENGMIAHFASAGGKLPPSVASNKDYTNKIAQFVRLLPTKSDNVRVNPKLNEWVTFDTEEEKNRFLMDFSSIASKGVFSFDKDKVGDFSHDGYHLVTIPGEYLKLTDLPSDIILLLSRTKIEGSILAIDQISVSDIG